MHFAAFRKFLGSIAPAGRESDETFVAASQFGEWRLPLRAWQHDAFAAWSSERPADALIVATPGAGKTRFAARVVHALLAARECRPRDRRRAARTSQGAGRARDGAERHPARSRVHQRDARARARRARCGRDVSASRRRAAAVSRARAAARRSWCSMRSITRAKKRRGARRCAMRSDARSYRLSMSGTPFRSDGAAIPFVRYEGGMSVADFSYDYAAALTTACAGRSSSRCTAAMRSGSAATVKRCTPRSIRCSSGVTRANGCARRSRSPRGSATCSKKPICGCSRCACRATRMPAVWLPR